MLEIGSAWSLKQNQSYVWSKGKMNTEHVVVIKQNTAYEETWRYDGEILKQDSHKVLLEAFFNRQDMPFHGIILKQHDRFLELYFSDRWYNIFEIHDRDDDEVKGWYCNVTFPAQMENGKITYVDLALDLWVYPDGKQLVLDEDEFEVLEISPEYKNSALQALEELKNLFKTQRNFNPFELFDQGR